jgi:SET domain-containing protein
MSLAIKRSFSGKGLFATRTFRKREFIIEYFGPMLTADEDEHKWRNRYLFRVSVNRYIDGNCTANVARFINHACRPNAEAISGRRIKIYAKREIKVGEEICFNYGREYVDLFLKACLCATCRTRQAKDGARDRSKKLFPST